MPEIRCPACGVIDRVPEERVGDTARCGRCHAPLAPPGAAAGPVTITDATFESAVTRSRSIPTLLVFRDGRQVDRLVGVQPRAPIDARLRPLLAAA